MLRICRNVGRDIMHGFKRRYTPAAGNLLLANRRLAAFRRDVQCGQVEVTLSLLCAAADNGGIYW